MIATSDTATNDTQNDMAGGRVKIASGATTMASSRASRQFAQFGARRPGVGMSGETAAFMALDLSDGQVVTGTRRRTDGSHAYESELT